MFKDARVGDKVWSVSQGWGVIVDINKSEYPVVVEFKESGTRRVFTYEGRWVATDPYPSLFWDEVKIVPPPKPKRKVTRVVEGYFNVYPPGTLSTMFHPSEDLANRRAGKNRVACIHIRKEYEVEE